MLEALISYCCVKDSDCSKENRRKVKDFLFVWTSTTTIMWFYVIFSYSVYDFPIVGNLGIIYSIIHTLTPLFYRYTRSLVLAGLTISMSALFFQVTFSIFNGGLDSPSVIWFTAHPVIMSFFGSRRLILFSVILNFFVVLGLFSLGNAGYFPADALHHKLTEVMKITSLVFLDIIIATYTIVFINTTRQGANELKERNKLIESLIRVISHDINNALTISVMTTEQLKKDSHKKLNLNDESRNAMTKKIERIEKSNQQIEEISKSILQWMKTQDGESSLEIENFPLNEISHFIQTNYDDLLKRKSLKLEYNSDVDDLTKIYFNPQSLRNQVINNILSNAIKFSPISGSIKVNITKDNKNLMISISDEGEGIEQSFIDKMFDPTTSSSRCGTSGEKGTGFGMPIVKLVLEQQNGSISVDSKMKSEENKESGTTVRIKVPLA